MKELKEKIMTAVMTRKRSVAIKPVVDYPKRGEKIVSRSYTLRIAAPLDAQGLEVSFNEGLWQPCRLADGHWWCDWSGYARGKYEVVARMETKDGRWISSEPRKLIVELPLQDESTDN